MIDIHTHILPSIDDGSDSLESSLEIILGEIQNGVEHIFCTPHALRSDVKPYTVQELKNQFNEFKTKIEESYPVKLYLGQEIFVRDDLITYLRKKQVLTMNDSNYLLLELPYDVKPNDFEEVVYACDLLGLKIVLAHVERYPFLNIEDIEKLSKQGILMQVNSSSVVAKEKNVKNKINKLFKKNLISFVASDIHSFRVNTMKEAYEITKSRYGEKTAKDVFFNNAKNVFNIK